MIIDMGLDWNEIFIEADRFRYRKVGPKLQVEVWSTDPLASYMGRWTLCTDPEVVKHITEHAGGDEREGESQ